MTPKPLIFAATSDLSGKVRGKAFPADQLEKRLVRGVGWTPTNVLINCFDGIGESFLIHLSINLKSIFDQLR